MGARTLEELLERMHEVILLVLEEMGEPDDDVAPRVVGLHTIAV